MTHLIDVENLRVTFPTRSGTFEAVRGISFTLGKERLGIVGESGSGKSMTGRALLILECIFAEPPVLEALGAGDAMRTIEGRNF